MKIFDMHVHSKYSFDNDADPEEIIMVAVERGLDGIVFTEHDTYEGSEPVELLKEKYGKYITILRGMEFSAPSSHILVYGIKEDLRSLEGASEAVFIEEVHRQGGIAIPAHPFRIGLGYSLADMKNLFAIEGMNGHNSPKENKLSVDMACKLTLPFIGGSDAHEPERVGFCYTEFLDDNINEDNIIEVLRAGRYRGRISEHYRELWGLPGSHFLLSSL
jgi:predicted metal-dependent phosphoesterase TrpH